MRRETDEELLRPGKREPGPGFHLWYLARNMLLGVAALALLGIVVIVLVNCPHPPQL